MTTNTIKYDIIELAKDLKAAGVNEKAIDAQVKFEKAKEENSNDTLVTKKDLKSEIDLVRKDLTIEGYKIIVTLAVLIPTIMKILEHFKF